MSRRHWPFMSGFSNSSFAARVTRWHSSILAINSSPYRRRRIGIEMPDATSVSLSMTRKQPGARSTLPA